MTDPAGPARGHMVLYDRMDLPLPPGDYQLHVETTVPLAGATLPAIDRHVRIEGPRFRLAPTEIAGVFPPRNARGPFTDAMPHVALGRRTLPWERTADPAGTLKLPAPTPGGPPPPTGAPPWLALLLFDETLAPEVTVLANRKVVDVLPAAVRAQLAPPADATCDAIEVDAQLLRQLLPSLEELHLLAHVRQVNVDDRELSAEDSHGWFAVVVCARVPLPDHKYRACLVSLEGRTDLIQVTPPPVASDVTVVGLPHDGAINAVEHAAVAVPAAGALAIDFTPIERIFRLTSQLILLHSWTFECTGTGTFQSLAEHLDIGMIGDVRGDWPKITDTGHLALPLRSRAGSEETAWYRGPLVPFPISRDTRGPYHSADQARRISLDTGLEDISYAAAFEVGRLLAAADARLAQELMRWRRGDYRRSVEARLRAVIRDRFPVLAERFRVADLAADLLGRWQGAGVRYIDPAEGLLIDRAPGLDPANLAVAWGVSAERATRVLSIDAAALAGALERPADPRPGLPATIEGVAGDAAALGRLAGARERLAPGAIDARGFYTGGAR